MSQGHRTRTPPGPAHFSPALNQRIEEFFYTFLAKMFVEAMKNGKRPTVQTLTTAVEKMGREQTLGLFHSICDGELLCPNCGEVHGTLDEFDSNLGATFRATMANLDIRRLRMEIDKLQTVSA